MSKKSTILGIHKTLFCYTLIATISSILVAVMGGLLLSNVLWPEAAARFGEIKGSGSKIVFVCVGSLFVLFGLIVAISLPYQARRNTRIVTHQTPESAQIRLIEEEWSDTTDFIVELYSGSQMKPYLAHSPRWLTKDLLGIPMTVKAYFDPKRNLVAVKAEQGLIWVLHSRNRH